jgi:acetyl esterase/lipase
VIGGVLVAIGAALATVRATPWPSALLIRAVFERGARATLREMAPHLPVDGFTERRDIPSGNGRNTTFDLVLPASAANPRAAANQPATAPSSAFATAPASVTATASASATPQSAPPVVVWIHGGAWISGSRRDVTPYLRLLAQHGYAGAALDYTIAPEAVYPTALQQLNSALAHLVDNAEDLGIDPSRIVLAGDSAGAQLASQLAAITTNADYARLVEIRPALTPAQLSGVVLHCGLYDLKAMAGEEGIIGWGFKSALWAYTGDKNWSETPAGRTMSTIDFVTADFPPTFISGGNGDGLTPGQSKRLAARLRAAGVPVSTLFWPDDQLPQLPHEYQFHLDYDEAFTALARTVEFLHRVTAGHPEPATSTERPAPGTGQPATSPGWPAGRTE